MLPFGLGLVPILSGSARLVELSGGPALLPARSDPSSVPLVVHIVSVIVYAVLGAFQFSARLRRNGWHRRAGRLLVVAGLALAMSAIWMTLYYPRSDGGDLLYLFRLFAAVTRLIPRRPCPPPTLPSCAVIARRARVPHARRIGRRPVRGLPAPARASGSGRAPT